MRHSGRLWRASLIHRETPSVKLENSLPVLFPGWGGHCAAKLGSGLSLIPRCACHVKQ